MDASQAVRALKPELIPDHEFFSVFECMEAYLAAQEDLAAALKAGHFDLAKAKYNLGPGALGQQFYPGDMHAAATVQLIDPPDQSGSLYEQFQLSCSLQQCHTQAPKSQQAESEEQPSSSSVDKRQQEQHQEQQQTPQKGSCGSKDSSNPHRDPVTWFSALPPAALKSAQAHFATALQRAVSAAVRVQQLRQLLDALQEGQEGAAAEGEQQELPLLYQSPGLG